MKLYLDDIRNPHQSGYKDDEWIVCRNNTNFKYESRKLYGLRRMANNFKKTKTYSVYFLDCCNEIFHKPE